MRLCLLGYVPNTKIEILLTEIYTPLLVNPFRSQLQIFDRTAKQPTRISAFAASARSVAMALLLTKTNGHEERTNDVETRPRKLTRCRISRPR